MVDRPEFLERIRSGLIARCVGSIMVRAAHLLRYLNALKILKRHGEAAR